jgi:hypothetical protein
MMSVLVMSFLLAVDLDVFVEVKFKQRSEASTDRNGVKLASY